MTTQCMECSRAVESLSPGKNAGLCSSCHKTLVQFELSRLRKYKFEKADFIVDNIYLGSENAAGNLDYLRGINVDRIVVAAKMTEAKFPKEIEYLVLEDLDDDPEDNIARYFEPVIAFIRKQTSSNVLVHCVSGISRSGTIVIAYLVQQKAMTFKEALAFVRGKRSVVHPNSGFQKQLMKFEQDQKAAREREKDE